MGWGEDLFQKSKQNEEYVATFFFTEERYVKPPKSQVHKHSEIGDGGF